jgi:hypothetical protein
MKKADLREYPQRINKPAVQRWFYPGRIKYHAYFVNDCWHNISNPSRIWYNQFGKINRKDYYISDIGHNKLTWMNIIKNIL